MAEYYTIRSRGTLQILSRLDIIGRTAELARLFGIQFFDVISRGSQVGQTQTLGSQVGQMEIQV